VKLSIRAKVILSITLVFIIGAAAAALFMLQSYNASVNAAALEAITRDATVFAEIEQANTAKLSATNYALQQSEAYREAFLARDREALLKLVTPTFENLKKDFAVTHFYFETPASESTIFLRAHKPAQFDDAIKRKTYMEAVKTGQPAAGLELGATAVALRVVRPYYDADGTTVIGYTELGEEAAGFLEDVKAQTGDDAGLLLAKASMDASGWAAMRTSSNLEDNWDDQKDYVLAASTNDEFADEMKFDRAIDTVPDEGEILGSFTEESGRHEVRGVFPVKDASGARIGLMFIMRDITEMSDSLKASSLRVLGVVIVMFAVVLGVVIVLLNSLVFGRLDRMIAGMESISTRVAGGDYDARYEADESEDEIGEFERFFARFTALISSALKQLSDEVARK